MPKDRARSGGTGDELNGLKKTLETAQHLMLQKCPFHLGDVRTKLRDLRLNPRQADGVRHELAMPIEPSKCFTMNSAIELSREEEAGMKTSGFSLENWRKGEKYSTKLDSAGTLRRLA